MLVEGGVGGAGAEGVHADEAAALTEEAVPALSDAGLDDDASGNFARQDAGAIGFVLLVEPLHAGHTDEADLKAVGRELFPGFDGNFELAASGDDEGGGL